MAKARPRDSPFAAPTARLCTLCRRKFRSDEALALHEQRSELHRELVHRQDELVRQHKEEVYASIRSVRVQLQEAMASARRLEAAGNGGAGNASTGAQRALEGQLRQLLGEYGQAQEMMEHGLKARGAGYGPNVPAAAKTVPEACTAQVGRLSLEASATSWVGGKEVQEDRFSLGLALRSPEGHAVVGFCVLDGHSGSLCVDHVAERLRGALQAKLTASAALTDETLRQAVDDACASIDAEFLARARGLQVMDGSTMVLALVYPDTRPGSGRAPGSCRLLVSNVGDSRAVLCRAVPAAAGDGPEASTGAAGAADRLTALRLSEDHKPDRPDEQQRIRAKGGCIDLHGVWRVFAPCPLTFSGRKIPRWGLAVSRAFGDVLLKEPERYGGEGITQGSLVIATPEHRVVDLDASQDRFLVLACDGVWDVLRDDDAVAVCAGQASVAVASHVLVRHAFAAGSADNLTAVVVSWRDALDS